MEEKFDLEFVEHMGYTIPKQDVEGFDPFTYFDGPILDERGLCGDEQCQKLGHCKNKRITNNNDSSNFATLETQ